RGGSAPRRPPPLQPHANLGVLLDAQFMSVLARLVVFRAAEDQLLERDALRRDEMEVLLLLDGTGRDHRLSAPWGSPARRAPQMAGRLLADRLGQIAVEGAEPADFLVPRR